VSFRDVSYVPHDLRVGAERVVILRKIDEDQRLAFGYASVVAKADGEPVVDSQGDVIEPDELERAAYAFVAAGGTGGVMHTRTRVATIVESCVINAAKLEAMGLEKDALPPGWWIGMRVDDADVWKRVKDGELRAFSIGGKGRRVSDEEAQ
jgi:hypothetical protein